MERDLIQDYLEDLLCLNRQQTPTTIQETKPEYVRDDTGNVDKQIPQTQNEETNSTDDEWCKTQGIEEIPWQQGNAKQVPLPLEVPETYKEAARRLGLFKPTAVNMAKPKESHKKGINTPINGTSKVLATTEHRSRPLSGLEYLEDLEDEDPTAEPEGMIVENHDITLGQEAQRMPETVQTTQEGAKHDHPSCMKHDLSDPHA